MGSTMHQSHPAPLDRSGARSSTFNTNLIYDFTKRKRWADLLVNELSECIMLILDESGTVMYCGPGNAIEELLGWRDEEIVDGSVGDIMNEEDRAVFQEHLSKAIVNNTEILTYVRFVCKSNSDIYPNVYGSAGYPSSSVAHYSYPQPSYMVGSSSTQHLLANGGADHSNSKSAKEVLFEIRGYPHYIEKSGEAHESGVGDGQHEGMEFKCFFAAAKPYPSRNTAMLNTFLELKIENERLQERLRNKRAELATLPPSSVPPGSSTNLPYGRRLSHPQPQSGGLSIEGTGMFYAYEDPPSSADGNGQNGHAEEKDPAGDHTLPRKKSRKTFTGEQYVCVTCGRTDSPEWRKGPLGPKTLCNACGLRWAKQVRRDPAAAEAEIAAAQRQQEFRKGTVCSSATSGANGNQRPGSSGNTGRSTSQNQGQDGTNSTNANSSPVAHQLSPVLNGHSDAQPQSQSTSAQYSPLSEQTPGYSQTSHNITRYPHHSPTTAQFSMTTQHHTTPLSQHAQNGATHYSQESQSSPIQYQQSHSHIPPSPSSQYSLSHNSPTQYIHHQLNGTGHYAQQSSGYSYPQGDVHRYHPYGSSHSHGGTGSN